MVDLYILTGDEKIIDYIKSNCSRWQTNVINYPSWPNQGIWKKIYKKNKEVISPSIYIIDLELLTDLNWINHIKKLRSEINRCYIILLINSMFDINHIFNNHLEILDVIETNSYENIEKLIDENLSYVTKYNIG